MPYVLRALLLTGGLSLLIAATPVQAETIVTKETIVKTTQIPDDADGMAAIREKMTRDLQTQLLARGYSVDVTGIYDAKTAAAVQAYQRDNGFAVTGEANPDLLSTLGIDSTIRSTEEVVDREVIRYRLGRRGSENANVYDDPSANRSGIRTFTPATPRLSERDGASTGQKPAPRGTLNR